MSILKKKTDAISALLPDESAVKNYFLEKGFSDLGATIRCSFQNNKRSIQDSIETIKTPSGGTLAKLAKRILHIVAIVAICVFGTIVTILLSFFHSLVIAAIMTVVYIGLSLSRLVDNIYISLRRVAVVCDKCKTRSVLPGYKCPECGKTHYRLQPNVYGILTHTCECGQKLPATFFVKTKGNAQGVKYRRKKLEALCANPNCSTQVFSMETHPLCIPVAGSRSVGKTAYLTAASHELIEDALPNMGCSIEYYSPEKEALYETIKTDFEHGETSMTIEPTNQNDPSAFSLSFFVEHPSLKPARLIHLFDIAGETFVRNAEHERQLHYSYADGVILIVDPMAIPDIREEYEDSLNDIDKKGIGGEDLNMVLSSLVTKIQNAGVLASSQQAKIPIAVVINKIDESGVSQFFSQDAKDTFSKAHPNIPSQEVMSELCKQFMRDKGAGNFVNTLDVSFSTVRYFACSAIGHSRGAGTYAPVGVLEPLKWIISSSDKQLAKLLK